MFLRNKLKLPQSQEAFDAFVSDFLVKSGFPDTDEYRRMFAVLIQHSPQNEDFIRAKDVVAAMRKAKANEFAFYLIHPDRRSTTDGPEAKEVAADVVPKA